MTMTDYSDMLERLEAEADSNERYGYLSRANFQIECADAIRSLLAAHEATKAELQALRDAADRCILIVERYNHRQNEKVDDVKLILRQALTRKDT
jgi:hypothetical protein